MNRHVKGCFGGWYGNWFTLVVLALGVLLSTSTAVQAQECVPDCRKGYVCTLAACPRSIVLVAPCPLAASRF